VSVLGEGLQYQYHGVWGHVLAVLAVLAEVIGKEHPSSLKPILTGLGQLRGSHNFSFEAELDHVVGKAVSAVGPKVVLEAIPLNIVAEKGKDDYEFKSSWLLPVLRDNLRNTKLAFFTSYFLPLASKCLARSSEAEKEGDKIGHKTYEVLTYQIWNLLPGFCISPTDLGISFRGIAKILGIQLGTRKEVRLNILTALRQLISKNLDNPENKAELTKYAKNFLPILFNLYTSVPQGAEEAGQRLAAFETAKLYFQITDDDLLSSMFDKAMEKIKSETQFTKDAILDILRSMMPYINESRIKVLYDETLSKIESKDHKEQKKAYRLLEELCRGTSEQMKLFVSSNLPQLRSKLLTSLSSASPSSQAPRLRCLFSIVSQLEDQNEEFAFAIIPEAVISIRAVNSKARAAAFNLLIAVGEALQRWSEESNDDIVRKYMSAMMAGLAGNPGLIHCTLLAISRIYFQFRDLFPDDLTGQILTNILVLLSSSSREVVGSGLSFVKVFVTSTPILESSKYVSNIVTALVDMPEDCKRHFRVKTKFLLERLVRKFGWDFVSSLVPKSEEKMHKRLKNMRKELARRARKMSEDSGCDDEELGYAKTKQKTMDDILADSSDEDLEDDNEVVKSKDKKKKKVAQTWIHEGSDNVVDLLSKNAAQVLSSTDPNAKATVEKKEKSKSGFKINNDGKFIINDDSSDEEHVRKRGNQMMEDSDSEDETFENLVNKKRKVGSSETGSTKTGKTNATGISAKTAFSGKYSTGGSGIHRNVEKGPGSEYKSKSGKGDVKKAGKHDPFAYIPMSHRALNKRKMLKAKGQFSSVMNSAKKGASKGRKERGKDVKQMKKLMKNMKV